jgi:putative flippase GtrA
LNSLRADTELAQGARFLLAGAFITVLYLSVTTGLRLAGAPWWLAIAVGYFIGASTHFVLHRYFVFRRAEGFQLGLEQQVPRFILFVICQYAVTATAMTLLPDSIFVFFGVAAAVTVASFLILRTKLFH